MTTKEDISHWFEEGKHNKAIFMFVMCDTFDWEDYPSYAYTVAQAHDKNNNVGNMQKIMEIYDLRKDKQKQLNTPTNMAEII